MAEKKKTKQDDAPIEETPVEETTAEATAPEAVVEEKPASLMTIWSAPCTRCALPWTWKGAMA